MPKKKILSIFGARPDAVKMAPLIKEIAKYPDIFENIVCVTGQHREMLDQVLNSFNIERIAQLPMAAAVILIAVSMFLTFIAGLLPSAAAARKDPVEALRSE